MYTIMDYRIEKKEGFRLLVYARMFTEESGEKGIPAFGEEYYRNEVYKKVPGYLGICDSRVPKIPKGAIATES